MLCRTAPYSPPASTRSPSCAPRRCEPRRCCRRAAAPQAARHSIQAALRRAIQQYEDAGVHLAGALIGTGFLSPREGKKGEHNAVRTIKLHLVVAAMSFCSELLSVMWATVAVNKLTKWWCAASSAFALLKRDFEPADCHQRALCARHVRVYGDDRPPRLPTLANLARRGGLGDERAGADGGDCESWRRERRRRREQPSRWKC